MMVWRVMAHTVADSFWGKNTLEYLFGNGSNTSAALLHPRALIC